MRIRILNEVDLFGKRIEEGTEIDLTIGYAQHLIKLGIAESLESIHNDVPPTVETPAKPAKRTLPIPVEEVGNQVETVEVTRSDDGLKTPKRRVGR